MAVGAMKLTLRHFTLHSPDEILPYWFVSHDFAQLLGVEYSSEAAKMLKRIVPGGARIDYEADAVVMRISRKERVMPALRAIYAHAGWDSSELDAAEKQIAGFRRPKPCRVAAGDAFLVPFADDLYALGQVLEIRYKAPTVAIFDSIGHAETLIKRGPSGLRPLTILHIGGNSLYKGAWQIIGSYPVVQDPSSGPGGRYGAVGSISYGGDGPIVDLLRAKAGLRSWEEGFYEPNYLRKLVLR
jgi:hypothetical protein